MTTCDCPTDDFDLLKTVEYKTSLFDLRKWLNLVTSGSYSWKKKIIQFVWISEIIAILTHVFLYLQKAYGFLNKLIYLVIL